MSPDILLTPPLLARRLIAGFVIPWMLSLNTCNQVHIMWIQKLGFLENPLSTFLCLFAPPFPRPLPPLPLPWSGMLVPFPPGQIWIQPFSDQFQIWTRQIPPGLFWSSRLPLRHYVGTEKKQKVKMFRPMRALGGRDDQWEETKCLWHYSTAWNKICLSWMIPLKSANNPNSHGKLLLKYISWVYSLVNCDYSFKICPPPPFLYVYYQIEIGGVGQKFSIHATSNWASSTLDLHQN